MVEGLNVLRRIEDFANDIAKDYANIHLVPRGTPTFLDQNLRGTIRFARRQGNFLPVISAENSTKLAANITPPTRTLTLDRVPSAFTRLGAVLDIGPQRELLRVADIDPSLGQVTADQDLRGTHVTGTQVDLFGVPIEIIGNPAAGSTVIQIRADDIVVAGDQIAIDTTTGLLSSTVSTGIIDAQFLGLTIENRRNYQVTLASGISRALINEENILLRGQPAYQSTATRARVVGPFVLDFISGSFFDEPKVDEFLNVRVLNSLGDPLPGFTDFVPVSKNTPIVDATIPSESMLFWNALIGSPQFRDGRFLAITDDQHRFTISQELVPSFPVGHEWEIPVRAEDTALFRVKFAPNDYRTFSLIAGVPQRVRVGIGPNELPSNRVEVVIQAQRPGTAVEINDWLPTTSAASSLEYQMTSTAFGSNVWQAGSLLLKPYFFTLDDIRARYDSTAYDQGVVHL